MSILSLFVGPTQVCGWMHGALLIQSANCWWCRMSTLHLLHACWPGCIGLPHRTQHWCFRLPKPDGLLGFPQQERCCCSSACILVLIWLGGAVQSAMVCMVCEAKPLELEHLCAAVQILLPLRLA